MGPLYFSYLKPCLVFSLYVKDLLLRCGNYQLVVWWASFSAYNMSALNDVSTLGHTTYLPLVNIDKVVSALLLVLIVILDFNKNYRSYLMIAR